MVLHCTLSFLIEGVVPESVVELKVMLLAISLQSISWENWNSTSTSSNSPSPTADSMRASWPGLNFVITGLGLTQFSIGTYALNPYGGISSVDTQPFNSVDPRIPSLLEEFCNVISSNG